MLRTIIGIYFIITEVLYFSYSLYYIKDLKGRKLSFFVLMLLAYLINSALYAYSVLFNILYTFVVFLILRILYKEKAHIIDVFVFTTLSINLVIISALTISIGAISNSFLVLALIKTIFMLLFIRIGLEPLKVFYHKYVSVWDRKVNSKIKSVTVRSLSLIVFNIFYYAVHLGLMYALK